MFMIVLVESELQRRIEQVVLLSGIWQAGSHTGAEEDVNNADEDSFSL